MHSFLNRKDLENIDLDDRRRTIHNHPSGDPAPSRADIDLTRAIVEAGKPLRIAVHDHLIIGTQGHVSLRAKGVI